MTKSDGGQQHNNQPTNGGVAAAAARQREVGATARGRRQLGDGAAAAAARRQQRGSCGGGGSAKADVSGSLAAARQRDVGGSLAAAVDGEDGVQWRRWGGTFDGRECVTMSGRDGSMTRVNAATIRRREGVQRKDDERRFYWGCLSNNNMSGVRRLEGLF